MGRDGSWSRLTAREAAAPEPGAPDALRLRSFWVPRFAQRDLAHFAVGARMLAQTWRAATPSNDSERSLQLLGELGCRIQLLTEPLHLGAGELERVLYNSASVVAALPSRPLWCLAADGGTRACHSRLVPAEAARVLRYGGTCSPSTAADCWRMSNDAVRDDALAPWRTAVAEQVHRVIDHLASEELLGPSSGN